MAAGALWLNTTRRQAPCPVPGSGAIAGSVCCAGSSQGGDYDYDYDHDNETTPVGASRDWTGIQMRNIRVFRDDIEDPDHFVITLELVPKAESRGRSVDTVMAIARSAYEDGRVSQIKTDLHIRKIPIEEGN